MQYAMQNAMCDAICNETCNGICNVICKALCNAICNAICNVIRAHLSSCPHRVPSWSCFVLVCPGPSEPGAFSDVSGSRASVASPILDKSKQHDACLGTGPGSLKVIAVARAVLKFHMYIC